MKALLALILLVLCVGVGIGGYAVYDSRQSNCVTTVTRSGATPGYDIEGNPVLLPGGYKGKLTKTTTCG